MERKWYPLIASTACLLALVSCAPTSIRGDVPAPAATATAQALDCTLNLTYDKLHQCTTQKDERIANLDEINEVINSPYVDEKYRAMYQKTITTMRTLLADEKTAHPQVSVKFSEYERNGVFGKTFVGCTGTISFDVDFVLPQGNNDKDNVFGTKWHEYEHISRAYQNYKNGIPCPYKSATDEELEIDYWGRYLQAAARRFGYPSESKKNNMHEIGNDPADIIYDILVPSNIGSENWLYDFIINSLSSRYIFISIIGKESIPFASQEIQDKIKQTEVDWKNHLKNATPQETEAIKQMVKLNLVAPDFFP